jgi:hypothetical protein
MPAEYKTVNLASDEELNDFAARGWTVKAAYSPTHFLLERLPPAPIPRAQPTAPTGVGRGHGVTG